MRVPLEITFRDVPKTETIETLIQEKAAALDRICDNLISCRVAVEKPHENQRFGNPFRVRVTMRVPPGHELVVRRESTEGELSDRLPTVIRDAFDAARRRLKKLVDRQQGEVKSHPAQENLAYVVKLFQDQGYGFLKTLEGREIYFHRNSVLNNDFERLELGTGVRFVAVEGNEGPQASTVQVVDKPGARRGKVNSARF
jgi:cold shock CspA family protein/ribosome-associated translation inhibitor RaiA